MPPNPAHRDQNTYFPIKKVLVGVTGQDGDGLFQVKAEAPLENLLACLLEVAARG